ncbi:MULTISPECIES: hypothetical protein [Massilia]|uniref:Uncharacterized protein n=1 Tax=Massilia haematophila TaxID=457923 RepID=A0ABV7PPP8_9BURK|nr:hypothetical protein [Massilia sp.]
MMDAGARFRHDSAGMEGNKNRDQLLTTEFIAQQSPALAVLIMHVRAVLAQDFADKRSVLHDGLRSK